MQLASISPADMQPIEAAPIRLGIELGPCLLFAPPAKATDSGYVIGWWDGEAWWDAEGGVRLRPERWLLLVA